jgi:hypothetical protein
MPIPCCDGFPKFSQFIRRMIQQTIDICPIEAKRRRATLHLRSPQEGGQTGWQSV